MSPPVIWNAFTWNSSLWGYSGDFELAYTHLIAEALSSADAATRDIVHELAETLAPDSAVNVSFSLDIANSTSASGEVTGETLGDGSGYDYVFPDRTTDAEGRDFPTWASGTAATSTWTTATASSTSWS